MQPPSLPKLETQQEEGFFSTGEEPNNGGLCLCDFCSDAPALLYCRADEARLCLSCDRHVHAANSVSSRHPRALLCDWCRRAPSSSLCCTQRLLLCQNCDFDAHHERLSGGHHVRRPVEPFSGCPGAAELMGLLGAGEDEKGLREGEEGGGEQQQQQQNQQWAWEEEEVLNLDDLVVPMDSGHGFQAAGVPPLPKDRNLSCGKHKEEIMRQLRRLLKSEFDVSDLLWDQEQDVKFQPPVAPESLGLENEDFVTQDAKLPDNDQVDFLLWEDGHCQPADCLWISHDQLMKTTTEDNQLISDSMDGGNGCNQIQDTVGEMENDHPISTEMMPLASPRACGLSGAERDSAISRYREKRKTRRYDKRIIYESRRTRAESRVRIKGRFAKMNLEPKS